MPVNPTVSPHITANKAALSKFLDTLYEVSDTKPLEGSDPYVDLFTSDATVIMGLNTFKGSKEIGVMRQGMWKFVTQRHHDLLNIAPMSSVEFLLNGTVEHTLINGKTLVTDWAGHMVFEDESLAKLTFYQVYLDPSEMNAALAE